MAARIPAFQRLEAPRQALQAGGMPWEIVIYPDTPRAFFAGYHASYRPEQATDGWSRLRTWFSPHGVA